MNVEEKVIEILKELSGEETINEADSLKEDIHLDSLDMVTMLVTLEEKLGAELLPEDMNPFDLQTVSDVIALIKKYEVGDLNA